MSGYIFRKLSGVLLNHYRQNQTRKFNRITRFEYNKSVGQFQIEFQEVEVISGAFRETIEKVVLTRWVNVTYESLQDLQVINLNKLPDNFTKQMETKF